MRKARVERNTNETQIMVELNLDGTGVYDVETGVGFLDHMLEQLSRHSLMATCILISTTPPKIAASQSARPLPRRLAIRRASRAMAAACCRWTRR